MAQAGLTQRRRQKHYDTSRSRRFPPRLPHPFCLLLLRVPPRPTASRQNDLAAAAPESLRPSKSQRKRDMTALQDLGEELVAQSREFLAAAPLPEALRDAIEEAKRISDHEGRRRQMQFIGKLMRRLDAEPIRIMLKLTHRASQRATVHLHRVESWRERLLEDDGAFAALGTMAGSALDGERLERLRTTVQLAREERRAHRAPHHYRDLFRQLRDVLSASSELP
jgi:ribosome-associated protein